MEHTDNEKNHAGAPSELNVGLGILKDIHSTILDLLNMDATKNWLLRHEIDIAAGINDYADLRELFTKIIGRAPNDIDA